ncbi:unnamed protein product [Blepharisma stoltei]|uniref:Uncharacterized protein n=1 Tax=Blepharisma stoltei TaxID=1481888 RepID=A0AAU9K9X8_9CILI|nr:unnamed protein product [Blepharisma stoltei]
MKKASKTRKRSTSAKKRRSVSKDSDEETLVNILNKRAESDRGILISQEQMEDFKKSKQALKEAQAKLNLSSQEIASLQHENFQLKQTLHRNESEIHALQRLHEEDQNRSRELSSLQNQTHSIDEQNSIAKLQIALSDTQSVLAYKTATAKRHLTIVSQLLQKQTDYIAEIGLLSPTKKGLSSNLWEITQCVESAIKVLEQDSRDSSISADIELENQKLRREIQNLKKKEENIETYRIALEKMKEQTQNLREKMKEVKSAEELKRILEEKDTKIDSLGREKNMLNDHIKVLQCSLTEQCSLIEQLKEVIATLTPKSSKNTTRESPKKETYEEIIPDVYEGEINQERELQNEIASLDQEILELQSSLQRALNR